MIEAAGDPIFWATRVATAFLALGLFLCLFRLWRGPTIADRVVALDLSAYLVVSLSAIRALADADVHLIRPALVLALLGFLGTVAFARYLERTVLG